ncbi:MAG: hypothetical protein KF802_14690 [Bdellovibrionaceae bacterium]|nr:hypothetical protein [Pseudobdellovibrionaceae bacterium]
MDKQRYFTIFSMIAFGSRDTLEHSISPLIGTLGDLDSLKEKILSDLKEKPVEAPEEILKSLDFEAFEKARLGYHSVGVSLIICCSELIKKIAGDRASANKHFGMTSQKAFEFYRLGPRINCVPWAEGVVCASNYVRHDDEWQELVNPISKKEDGVSFNISYKDLNWDEQVATFPEDAKRNVTTLKSAGIPYESFLKHSSMAGFEIAKVLSLSEKEKTLALFDEWVTAVVKDLQNNLGIK